VPVPVMKGDGVTVEQVLAGATRVRNVLPEGATWDGRTELLVDADRLRELMDEREDAPAATPAAASRPAAGAAPAAPAPRAGSRPAAARTSAR
jgi:hypothetical protein